MRVYELIEKLKHIPQFTTVKLDDGEYLDEVGVVESDDERKYVIIRPR